MVAIIYEKKCLFWKNIYAVIDRDIDAFENRHHADIIYVHDYSFSDRADDLVGLKEYIQDTDWHHETRCVHEDAFFKKKLFFTIFDSKVFSGSGQKLRRSRFAKNGSALKKNGIQLS